MPQSQPAPRQQAIAEARALAAALVGKVDQVVALSVGVGLGDARRVESARLAAANAAIAVMMLRD